MAYYGYYQQTPHWGQASYANQYNQLAPPLPSYQPQPTWTGQDYFSAHYGLANNGIIDNSDVNMFDYVWSRLKGLVGAQAARTSEARHWHSRVYGGYVDITTLLPGDLGAAAGYETFRLFNYHKSVYRQPLMDDWDREEEALAGLAIAEATKLWSYCQRPTDKYGRRETCEVAAATAQRLLRKSHRAGGLYSFEDSTSSSEFDDDYRLSRRRRLGRRRSSLGYGAATSLAVGPYLGVESTSMPTYQGQIAYPAASTNYPTYGTQSIGYNPAYPQYGNAPYSGAGVGGLVVPAQKAKSCVLHIPCYTRILLRKSPRKH
ncbi:hypothetical protein BS47DRAFT_563721 [Hydnum rufescens UP504]|uniref:Uncharacterized protein n=1 Tax=Hydnum rufescens UP504 TaxID=1448309 RepID=A0A9P6AGB7_9AGAM|nr:hypothetical protein BS47DRAFT_563721 [Hydnum rufescens UP504]